MRDDPSSGLLPESSLLLEITSPVAPASQAGTDFQGCRWDLLYEQARRQQVLALLALHAARGTSPDGIPEPYRTRLSHTRTAAALADQQQVEQLGELLADLQRNGIEVMLLKGRGLSERLYKDPAARSSVDIDLLVRPADIDAVGAILEERGYEAFRPALFRRSHFHLPYVLRNTNWPTIIELHWDVTFKDSPVRFDTSGWWETGIRTELRSGKVLVPSREDELVYTSFHGANRGGLTLRDLGDIARLRCHEPAELSWDTVFQTARDAGCLSFLRMVHTLCEALWPITKVPIPEELGKPGWKMRLISNLISRRTVLAAGIETWWPYKRILYWAALPDGRGATSNLFSSENHFMQDLAESDPHVHQHSSILRITPRVLTALLYCLLPLNLFPATREAVLLGSRRPGPEGV
ncbi:MAG: nucleotidyltransferase family protein [Acidobacteria bacterium]|uniref:Nucleotidyltransferase family protein n=1 Tax=Candidatus Polarisedimenticola svalbardensis TaxID=2886004 RepID=A0A8J6XVY1_9BACT|nr:nucleotidyltransferase family protein [Candidatus Polarisedimenticola svalbardensis]